MGDIVIKTENVVIDKSQSLEIKVKYFDDKFESLESIEKGDWVDLRAAEDIALEKGDFALVPLGIAMEIPKGYEAHLVPRSSTFKKWGIIQTNSIGIIDNSYSGDNDQWMMPVLAMRNTYIAKGDRICQFRVMENQPKLSFLRVDKLEGPDRGGFGSTGTN